MEKYNFHWLISSENIIVLMVLHQGETVIDQKSALGLDELVFITNQTNPGSVHFSYGFPIWSGMTT